MSKQKKELVPELRFPEFEKEPNWPCVRLNAVAKRSTSKNKGEKITRVLTNSAVNGVVDQRDYFDKDIAVKGNLESYYIVDKGDYVYNPRISSTAPVGPISKNKVGKGVMSPLYTVFRFNSKTNDFFEQFFKSSKWYAYLQTVSNSGARHDRMSIASSDFMAMPVPNPCELEQQKIADCLTSIDELITLHTQKLYALKAHKQGLMQQLFPAEGETVPKLRFPEFRSTEGWRGEAISNCLEKIIDYRGKAPPKSDTGIPLITAKNVRTGWLDMSCDEYIEAGQYEDWMSKGIPSAGDVLFTTEAPLGNVALFPATGKYALGQRIITLRVKAKKCLPEFLFQSLLSPRMQRDIEYHSTGSTAKGIKSSIFVKLSLFYPSIQEQRKIIDFLSSIDSLIQSQDTKIKVLKSHKVGLMQKFFPVMDEVA